MSNRLNFIKYAEMLEEQPRLEAKAANAFRLLFKNYPGRRLSKARKSEQEKRKTLTVWRERSGYHSRHGEANREYAASKRIPRMITLPGGVTISTRMKKTPAVA